MVSKPDSCVQPVHLSGGGAHVLLSLKHATKLSKKTWTAPGTSDGVESTRHALLSNVSAKNVRILLSSHTICWGALVNQGVYKDNNRGMSSRQKGQLSDQILFQARSEKPLCKVNFGATKSSRRFRMPDWSVESPCKVLQGFDYVCSLRLHLSLLYALHLLGQSS